MKKEYTEDKKHLLAIHIQLYQQTWSLYKERMQYEFKVTLAYWTALALAIAGSIKFETFPKIPYGIWAVEAIGLSIVVAHGWWCWGIWKAQGKDKRIAIAYQREINKIIGFTFKYTLRKELSEKSGKYSQIFQVWVTALLVLIFILINWAKL